MCNVFHTAIISALKNLQEKIRRLELDKQRAELSLQNMERDVSQAHLFREGVAHRPSHAHTDRERCNQSSCNPGGCTNEPKLRNHIGFAALHKLKDIKCKVE